MDVAFHRAVLIGVRKNHSRAAARRIRSRDVVRLMRLTLVPVVITDRAMKDEAD
jgi:hypothetical protein